MLIESQVYAVDCIWTGFESPVEWEDHQNVFSADGPDVQYVVGKLIFLIL